MASNSRKKVRPTAYKDPAGWGDSVSVSRKAKEELAEIVASQETPLQEYNNEQASKLKQYNSYVNDGKPEKRKTKGKNGSDKNELDSQLQQLSSEIDRTVTEIENVMDRFLNSLWREISNLFLGIYNLLLKVVLFVFVEPIKNAGKFSVFILNSVNEKLDDFNSWVQSPGSKPKKAAPVRAERTPPATVQPKKEDFIKKIEQQFPDVFYGINFSHLAKKGIVFLNIKNSPIYENDLTGISVEEEQNLLITAIKEINNCARLAKSLPAPTKGRYVSRPMEDILERAGMNDLKAFMQYVDNHPKPFIERKLRLSEAFATWAHKGGPVQ